MTDTKKLEEIDNTGKAAIFDLDGTLLDSMGAWDEIDQDFLGERGIEVPDDFMTAVAVMPFRQIAEYTIDRFHLKDTPDELIADWTERARTFYAERVEAKDGAVEYLKNLKATGAKLGVATSLPAELRDLAMKHAGIYDYFDTFVSVEDVDDTGKDNPDVYLLAAERLGVEPKYCTVYEDSLLGVQSAQQAGMWAIGVHDDSSDEQWDEIVVTADEVVLDYGKLEAEVELKTAPDRS